MLELVTGGELFDKIGKLSASPLSPSLSAVLCVHLRWCRGLCLFVGYEPIGMVSFLVVASEGKFEEDVARKYFRQLIAGGSLFPSVALCALACTYTGRVRCIHFSGGFARCRPTQLMRLLCPVQALNTVMLKA